MKKVIFFLLLVFSLSYCKAQSLQAGIYTGISFYRAGLNDAFTKDVNAWDNQLFLSWYPRWTRFGIETSGGVFIRKYPLDIYGPLPDPNVDGEYKITDWQWNTRLQFCVFRLMNKRLLCYIGATYTLFSEHLLAKDWYTNVPNSRKESATDEFIFPYYGVNIKASYLFTKRLTSNLFFEYKSEGGDLYYATGDISFYPQIPNFCYTIQLGLSYSLF